MNSLVEKFKNGWAKLKTIKNIEIIIGIVIICIIVLIYSSVTSNNGGQLNGMKENDIGSASELEQRLGEILSEIEGAGRVSVMVTYETSKGVTQSGSGARTEGAVIKGVVIVADGADNVKVRLNLVAASQTLLDIDANSIQIYDRK